MCQRVRSRAAGGWGLCPIAVLLSAAALGKTTGGIAGTVVEADGPVAGAVVIASGEALQGEQIVQTDGTGAFELSALPPGSYTLNVQASGYQSFTQENVAVHLDRTLWLQLRMRREGSTGAAVTGTQLPVVSAPPTATGGTISRDQMEILPYGRETRSFETAAASVPGVLVEPRGLRIPGAQPQEARYFLDGLDVTNLAVPEPGTRLTQRFIDEVSVLTGSSSAEYGRATGAIVHAVTRSGGNEFHGSLFTDALPLELSRSQPGAALRYALQPGFELGGPLQRDRLWFYAGFAPETIWYQSRTHTDLEYVGKLTWKPGDDHALSLSAFGDPGTGVGSNDLSLRYSGKLPGLLLEGTAGWRHARAGADRVEGALTGSHLLQLAGHHLLKAGVDLAHESVIGANQTLLSAFAQDRWSVLDALFLDAGVRYEQQRGPSALSAWLPRLGLSWDFTGRGLGKLYASYGRFFQPLSLGLTGGTTQDAFSSGAQLQLHRDLVASLDYTHREDRRRSDGVTLSIGKPLSENYLLRASYTFSSWRGDPVLTAGGAPHLLQLEAAWLYEWTLRTTVSFAAGLRYSNRAAAEIGVDLRAMLRYALSSTYQLAVSLDVLNALDHQADLYQPPLAARLGAALSF